MSSGRRAVLLYCNGLHQQLLPYSSIMPRAHRPSTPSDELEAFAGRRASFAAGVISAELKAFCQSGISIIVAARGRDGEPIGGLALGCAFDPSGHARILMARRANEALLQAFEAGSGIAATFSRPVDHRSIQLKASAARIVPVRAGDDTLLAAQCAGMTRELLEVGYSQTFALGYCAFTLADIVAVAFEPEQAFVQTPGPGAGSRLTP
jgi:hypothetical protein